MRARTLALTCALACGTETPPNVLEPAKPGLVAKPRWLTFTKVDPGSVTTLTVAVEIVGTRSIAIKRVVLDDHERTDFTFQVKARTPPFVLKPGERFEIDVTYQPNGDPRLGDVDLLVTYTDSSATEGPERIPPGELAVPLVRRLIGEPLMVVSPTELLFGGVQLGQERMLPLRIQNTGMGNVGLVIESADSTAPDITVPELPPNAIMPGTEGELAVVFRPTEEAYRDGTLTIRSFDPTALPAVVRVRGTSIAGPSIVTDPETVDFGEVPVGNVESRSVELVNRGNQVLDLGTVELSDTVGGMLTLKRTLTSSKSQLAVLDTSEYKIELDARARGQIATTLRITSSDASHPVVEIPILALVTEPAIELMPGTLDFGALPRGWVEAHPVELQNAGFGALTITEVQFVLGTSDLFSLKTIPSLPVTLQHGERIGFEIEFRAETEAAFTGRLAISSNDAKNPYVELQLSASGVSCEAGCPIANGEPSCTAGLCSIGSCHDGFYDTDGALSTGCECRELGQDPGEFCPDAVNVGTLDDGDSDRAQYTGLITAEDDVDLIRFYGQDSSQFFSEDYDVRITLETGDSNIEFCVYRHDTGVTDPSCFLDSENCPGSSRSYRHEGSAGPEDGADYVIKVFRKPGSAPSCTPYTLFMRNG